MRVSYRADVARLIGKPVD